jgi:hypothetical protein
MNTIKTRLHAFWLDLTDPEQKAKFEAICAERRAQGVKPFVSWSPDHSSHYLAWARQDLHPEGLEIELEQGFLFKDQWNTVPMGGGNGHRVFDFTYDAPGSPGQASRTIRKGHWLEITDEMKEVRRAVRVCGYCGAHYGPDRTPIPDDGFCPKCLGSEYLKAEDLRLLRLLPVAESFGGDRPELTDEERAALLPRYREAQKYGSDERTRKAIDARRARALELPEKARQKVVEAEKIRDARLWCLDRGLLRAEGNLIYYGHTGRFCFGWNKPLDGDDLSQLLDAVSEFRWPYDIECADGRTLSGG